MIPWKPDPRFPLFLSHFLIFYLLLCVPTFCFCLAGFILQLRRWRDTYDTAFCENYRIVALAIAFPTSLLALVHAVGLIFLSVRQRLTVNKLLYSSLAVSILWIPTLVVGWHPSQFTTYYERYFDSDDGYYSHECRSATGLFFSANYSYIDNTYELTPRLQVLMGVIILTLATFGWAFILFWFGYVHYWRTLRPRGRYYVPAGENTSSENQGGDGTGEEMVQPVAAPVAPNPPNEG